MGHLLQMVARLDGAIRDLDRAIRLASQAATTARASATEFAQAGEGADNPAPAKAATAANQAADEAAAAITAWAEARNKLITYTCGICSSYRPPTGLAGSVVGDDLAILTRIWRNVADPGFQPRPAVRDRHGNLVWERSVSAENPQFIALRHRLIKNTWRTVLCRVRAGFILALITIRRRWLPPSTRTRKTYGRRIIRTIPAGIGAGKPELNLTDRWASIVAPDRKLGSCVCIATERDPSMHSRGTHHD